MGLKRFSKFTSEVERLQRKLDEETKRANRAEEAMELYIEKEKKLAAQWDNLFGYTGKDKEADASTEPYLAKG